MSVKIRLTRLGRKKKPMYRIIAIDGRSKRDGAALENLGTYDPLKDQIIQYHADRVNYWLGQGAEASDAVKKISRLYATLPQATAPASHS